MRRPNRALPKGVWFQKKRLADGTVVRYGYYGPGRGPDTVSLGREGSLEFIEALAKAVRKEPTANTVTNLIWRYKQSPEFRGLRDLTRSDYMHQLDKIQSTFGALSLKAMASPKIALHIFDWRDSMAHSPRRADYGVQVLKALLSWGLKRGLVEANRAAGVGRLYKSDRREKTWSDEQVEAFMKVASEPMRRALVLAIETGQRQGDLLQLPWAAIQGSTLRLRQSKTAVRVSVPVSPALRACLDEAPRGRSLVILTKSNGLPWEPNGNGFRSAWRAACKAASIKGVTFHDLRGTFVTRRLSEGWTTQEVAMCTGHSLRDLASLDTYADRGSVADASAERIAKRERANEQ